MLTTGVTASPLYRNILPDTRINFFTKKLSTLQQDTTVFTENANSHFVVCCFYTPNYASHAENLLQSVQRFGLNHCVKQYEDRGYWEANTRIKPEFVLECLQRFEGRDVLYIDADAEIKKELSFFEGLDCDICAYDGSGQAHMSHKYLASTIFFKNTAATHKLVQDWIAAQDDKNAGKFQVDQDSLDMAMAQNADQLNVLPMPERFIKIYDRPADGQEPHIVQYQASRSTTKLRRKWIRRRNTAVGIGLLLVLAAVLYAAFRAGN